MAASPRLRSRTWLYGLGGGLVAVIAASGALVAWLATDVDNVTRGSLAWRVMLPGYLRALPTPDACDEPRYSFQGIDGARPQVAAVRFRTRLSSDAARAGYASLTAGCQPDSAAPAARWMCVGRDFSEVEIEVGEAPQGACRQVHIRFMAR